MPRYFLQRPAPDHHLASQHHAFALDASALGSASRRYHAPICEFAKVASALFRSADRNIRSWHTQPHPARPGHLLRHDDLVSLAVVTPRLGSRLHRGFHADSYSPRAAVTRLGL